MNLTELKEIAGQFGCNVDLIHFPDGQGHTYRCGDIVIKRAVNEAEHIALAAILAELPNSTKLRLPKPVMSTDGRLVVDGYVAWTFLTGDDLCGHYTEKVAAIDAYNELFQNVAKPTFIDERTDGWSIADRVSWGEETKTYEPVFQNLIDEITPLLEAIDLPAQLIHGDMARHILLAPKQPPAIIDITPYWRPKDFAHAMMMVTDVAWWEGEIADFDFLKTRPHWRQLVIRAALKRIIEQPEQMEYIGKDRTVAIERAEAYSRALTEILQTL